MATQVLKQNGFHLFLIKQEKMAKMVKTVNLLMKLLLEMVIPEQRHNGLHLLLIEAGEAGQNGTNGKSA